MHVLTCFLLNWCCCTLSTWIWPFCVFYFLFFPIYKYSFTKNTFMSWSITQKGFFNEFYSFCLIFYIYFYDACASACSCSIDQIAVNRNIFDRWFTWKLELPPIGATIVTIEICQNLCAKFGHYRFFLFVLYSHKIIIHIKSNKNWIQIIWTLLSFRFYKSPNR